MQELQKLPAWIGKAVAKIHINRLNQKDVAEKMGMSPNRLSEILNGKKMPKTAKERVNTAIEEILNERNNEHK